MMPGPPAAGRTGGNPTVTAALATLTDVTGIIGSFVFAPNGRVVAREIHAMFDDGALTEAAERLARLQETFGSVGDQLELAVIRFQSHKLYLRTLVGGVLCILAEDGVNMAALRMAANLVGRRVMPELAGPATTDHTPDGRSPSPNGNAADGAAPGGVSPRMPVIAPGTGVRRFRGRTFSPD